ncbi:MAG: exodeoxyribonuclease VII large subunit [Myxococcota bacterium]|jgi:exodeoxyribonuclease VII large subunit
MDGPSTAPKPLSVTELTRVLKQTISRHFDEVYVEGEVASFNAHRSGHWYFSLKDARAAINAVMFRGINQKMDWQPRIGDKVIIKGQLDIYAPQGKYNLLARRMMRAGQGAHQQKVEALKRKLQAEGAMDPARKRRLPLVPRAIGIATSASGAALHDIRKVIDRRFPNVTLYLVSCRVQGQGAAEDVARALRLLSDDGRCDVIIVGRGGGSREDLAAFDEEVVARAILASRVPVVSAVGHEIDVSVADLVADLRAATPSHAAELVVPERAELLRRITKLHERLLWATHRDLKRRREQVRRVRLRHPRERLTEARLRTDELSDRLLQAMLRDLLARRQFIEVAHARLRHPSQRISEARARCGALEQQLQQAMLRDLLARRQLLAVTRAHLPQPGQQISKARRRLEELEERLNQTMRWRLADHKQRVRIDAGRLSALSPLAVLARGYSLTLHDGRAVRDAAELSPGDRVELRFARGSTSATIDPD